MLTPGARTLQRRVGSAWLTTGGRVEMDPAVAQMAGSQMAGSRLYAPALDAMVTPGDGEPFLDAMLAAYRGVGAFAVAVPARPEQLAFDV